jgi:hypothetical protein
LEEQNVKVLVNTKEIEDNNGKDLVAAYPCKNYSIRCMSQEQGDLESVDRKTWTNPRLTTVAFTVTLRLHLRTVFFFQ